MHPCVTRTIHPLDPRCLRVSGDSVPCFRDGETRFNPATDSRLGIGASARADSAYPETLPHD